MRRIWLAAMVLLAASASAAPTLALVLLDPERAGPRVDPLTYDHAEWVLWPPGHNQVGSLLTGIDWAGDVPVVFEERGADGGEVFRITAIEDLKLRCYFEAERKILVGQTSALYADSGSHTTREAVFLSARGPDRIAMRPLQSSLGNGDLLICQANGWNDVAAIATRTERMIVVEYPPPGGQAWSRYWLYGRWPQSVPAFTETGVPGLTPARRIGALLMNPAIASWHPDDSGTWGGPNRWLDGARGTGPELLATLGAIAAYVVFCAVYCVVNQHRGRLAAAMQLGLLLAPAGLVFEGRFAGMMGPASTAIAFVLAWSTVIAATAVLSGVLPKILPDAWSMLAIGSAGLLGCLAGNPTWSMLNGAFWGERSVLTPWTFGIALLYGGIIITHVGRAAGLVLATATCLGLLWLGGSPAMAVVPFLFFLAAQGWVRWATLPVLAIFPPSVLALAERGAAWTPQGLAWTAAESTAVRFDLSAGLLSSLPFLTTLSIVVAAAILGGRFMFRQTRRAMRRSSGEWALTMSAAGSGVLSILDPTMLRVAIVLGLGAGAMVLVDALRED